MAKSKKKRLKGKRVHEDIYAHLPRQGSNFKVESIPSYLRREQQEFLATVQNQSSSQQYDRIGDLLRNADEMQRAEERRERRIRELQQEQQKRIRRDALRPAEHDGDSDRGRWFW